MQLNDKKGVSIRENNKKGVSIREMVPAVTFNMPPERPAYVQTVDPKKPTGDTSFKNFYHSNVKSFNQPTIDPFVKKAADYIKNNEGVRYRLYKDSKGFWTIGIGHLVKADELSKFKDRTLTDKEVHDLFARDLESKLTLVQRHFPQYNTYSDDLKVAILDGYFRGDLSGSPKTRELIRAGQFKAASKEYLNNAEYRSALKTGSGVAKRMQRNAKIFAQQS